MKRKYLIIVVALVVVYIGTWIESYRLGITDYMMNMRYFHYGSYPGSPGDKIGYVVYWPIYKTRYIIQTFQDEGHDDVHWLDRIPPIYEGQKENK